MLTTEEVLATAERSGSDWMEGGASSMSMTRSPPSSISSSRSSLIRNEFLSLVDLLVRLLAATNRHQLTDLCAGGFTVLAALCDSKVFGAGVSQYGISDLRALAGETHKFESQYLFSLVGGTFEEIPEVSAVSRSLSTILINHFSDI